MGTEPEEDQAQRRIELSTPQDLAYLVANVRRAAAEHIAEAFPHIEGQPSDGDELRNQVEELVSQYITKTFTLAAPNLSINGLPVPSDVLTKGFPPSSSSDSNNDNEDAEALYEPFDTAKRHRLAELVTQEEKLLEEVAALKRSVPASVAAEHERVLAEAVSRDEELLQRTLERAGKPPRGLSVGVEPLQRQEGVEGGFRRAVDGLARLKMDMPSVVARMERARVAGEYVVEDGVASS